MFRCVKITFEEKKVYKVGTTDPVLETSVSVQFEQATDLAGSLHGYGYASFTLSPEEHRELGYQVGQVYALNHT
jgi:hypothetical protein